MSRTDRNRHNDLRNGLDFRDRTEPIPTQRQLVQVYDGGSIPTDVPKVYVTHPVLVDADDAEGAEPTYKVDAETTIPVVMLGPRVPVVGDLLVAHAVGGRWAARSDKGGTTGCTPCDLPVGTSIRITIIRTSAFSTVTYGPYTMTYASTLGGVTIDNWSFPCQTDSSLSGVISCSSTGGALVFIPLLWFEGCPPFGFGNDTFIGLSLVDFTCDPIHLHYQGTTEAAPGFTYNFYIDYP